MSSLYPARRKAPESYTTEFDILKASHKFLRSEDEDVAKTWDDQLAKKYEDSLFKEFAVCDLKHYKSGKIALRWRTEDEVLSGAGETSCGNTRCPYHDALVEPASSGSRDAHSRPPRPPKLTTMELPFAYIEQGEAKPREAMVKVVLCDRCVRKMIWKREKEKKDRVVSLEHDERLLPEEGPEKSGRSDASALERRNRRHRSRERGDERRSERNEGRSRSPGRRIEGKRISRGP